MLYDSTVLLRRSILAGQRFPTEYYHEDYVFWLGLLKAGHRAIACTEVLADYRLPVDEALIAAGNYDLESGSRLFSAFLNMPQPPTAVFVTNYDMTLGAIMAAHERGVALPDEVDFIGYDNVDLCSIVSPKLEIVEQPMDEMGLRAAELLLARLTGDASPAKLLRLKAKLSNL